MDQFSVQLGTGFLKSGSPCSLLFLSPSPPSPFQAEFPSEHGRLTIHLLALASKTHARKELIGTSYSQAGAGSLTLMLQTFIPKALLVFHIKPSYSAFPAPPKFFLLAPYFSFFLISYISLNSPFPDSNLHPLVLNSWIHPGWTLGNSPVAPLEKAKKSLCHLTVEDLHTITAFGMKNRCPRCPCQRRMYKAWTPGWKFHKNHEIHGQQLRNIEVPAWVSRWGPRTWHRLRNPKGPRNSHRLEFEAQEPVPEVPSI